MPSLFVSITISSHLNGEENRQKANQTPKAEAAVQVLKYID